MGWREWFKMAKPAGHEDQRRARKLLQLIYDQQKAIDRWVGIRDKARQRNDMEKQRAAAEHIVTLELKKLELERALEEVDKRILEEARSQSRAA